MSKLDCYRVERKDTGEVVFEGELEGDKARDYLRQGYNLYILFFGYWISVKGGPGL